MMKNMDNDVRLNIEFKVTPQGARCMDWIDGGEQNSLRSKFIRAGCNEGSQTVRAKMAWHLDQAMWRANGCVERLNQAIQDGWLIVSKIHEDPTASLKLSFRHMGGGNTRLPEGIISGDSWSLEQFWTIRRCRELGMFNVAWQQANIRLATISSYHGDQVLEGTATVDDLPKTLVPESMAVPASSEKEDTSEKYASTAAAKLDPVTTLTSTTTGFNKASQTSVTATAAPLPIPDATTVAGIRFQISIAGEAFIFGTSHSDSESLKKFIRDGCNNVERSPKWSFERAIQLNPSLDNGNLLNKAVRGQYLNVIEVCLLDAGAEYQLVFGIAMHYSGGILDTCRMADVLPGGESIWSLEQFSVNGKYNVDAFQTVWREGVLNLRRVIRPCPQQTSSASTASTVNPDQDKKHLVASLLTVPASTTTAVAAATSAATTTINATSVPIVATDNQLKGQAIAPVTAGQPKVQIMIASAVAVELLSKEPQLYALRTSATGLSKDEQKGMIEFLNAGCHEKSRVWHMDRAIQHLPNAQEMIGKMFHNAITHGFLILVPTTPPLYLSATGVFHLLEANSVMHSVTKYFLMLGTITSNNAWGGFHQVEHQVRMEIDRAQHDPLVLGVFRFIVSRYDDYLALAVEQQWLSPRNPLSTDD